MAMSGTRKLPKPFARPRIEVPDRPRVWADVPAQDVRVGDVVPGVGRVLAVRLRTLSGEVQLAGPEVVRTELAGTVIKAFVEV